MIFDILTEDNFLLYAAKNYDNPGCADVEEFYEDLNRFKYVKRLFNKYKETGELKERLIINHLITIYNVFGRVAGTRMLFFKLDGYYECLKPFLILLNYLPDSVHGIGNKGTIITTDISLDMTIVKTLRNI